MGKRYLIDSNIIIGFQENTLSAAGQSLVAKILDEEFNISIINKIELLGYRDVTTKTKEFLSLANVFDLNEAVVNASIEIRRKNKIKIPDAIIAATAQVHDLILVTRNTKDFTTVSRLNISNPYSL